MKSKFVLTVLMLGCASILTIPDVAKAQLTAPANGKKPNILSEVTGTAGNNRSTT